MIVVRTGDFSRPAPELLWRAPRTPPPPTWLPPTWGALPAPLLENSIAAHVLYEVATLPQVTIPYPECLPEALYLDFAEAVCRCAGAAQTIEVISLSWELIWCFLRCPSCPRGEDGMVLERWITGKAVSRYPWHVAYSAFAQEVSAHAC